MMRTICTISTSRKSSRPIAWSAAVDTEPVGVGRQRVAEVRVGRRGALHPLPHELVLPAEARLLHRQQRRQRRDRVSTPGERRSRATHGGIAGIADAVAIAVGLERIRRGRTVVELVGHPVVVEVADGRADGDPLGDTAGIRRAVVRACARPRGGERATARR
jgi:hypothetical protein